MEKYDVIIIGAGPGGLTAALYCGRYRMKALVLTKDIGGLAATAHKVCNFPSHVEIKGPELMKKFADQVKKLEISIVHQEVIEITKKQKEFEVKTNKQTYKAKKIIFCAGTKHKTFDVPGEKEFLGKGVSYCATCDATFFKQKTVAVIGGSNSALTAALLLSEYATKVYLIHRRDNFSRAEPAWVESVEKQKKIEVSFNEEVEEIQGKTKVEAVKLKSTKQLKVDGVFIEIGSESDLNILKCLDIKTQDGYVIANLEQETNLKGFFAAGDITNNPLKQIITACAQGATAATNAYRQIKKEGK